MGHSLCKRWSLECAEASGSYLQMVKKRLGNLPGSASAGSKSLKVPS